MNHKIYIALGTNMGDRMGNLQAAQIALQPTIEILAVSSVYETTPWGYLDQPDFLNQVIKGRTDLTPFSLLDFLKELEVELGRLPVNHSNQGARYGPRLIDLDILFFDGIVLDTDKLIIPHPLIVERAFVLVPLAELVPKLRHPKNGKTMQTLLSEVDISGVALYHGN
jgi:2-amino-4-hydroxy-6-hydroxymethyldihydropteridine diphosphokinase